MVEKLKRLKKFFISWSGNEEKLRSNGFRNGFRIAGTFRKGRTVLSNSKFIPVRRRKWQTQTMGVGTTKRQKWFSGSGGLSVFNVLKDTT